MNNADIDALSGRELKIVIAETFEYTPSEYPAGGNWLFAPDGSGIIHIDDLPDWPTDIALAWELDGEGWEWGECEFYDSYFQFGDAIELWLVVAVTHAKATAQAMVKVSDFPTKAVAYAIARCRAWLKAKYAERGER